MASAGGSGHSPELGEMFESQARADEELAKDLAESLDRVWIPYAYARFPKPQPVPLVRLERTSIGVLSRASHLFFQKHGNVWPRFIVTASGVTVEFGAVPGA